MEGRELSSDHAGEVASEVKNPEVIRKAPLDVLVVCGMGPVKLMDIKGSERLFPAQPYNRLNAIAAKLIASNGIAETVIVSGTKSAKEGTAREVDTSEAELLADTYDRARGKGVTAQGNQKAAEVLELDRQARTTFDNIIQALNILDGRNNGYWEGSFGLLSAQFHGPRLQEMLRAFGIKNSYVLSAENVLRHYGYQGRLYPSGDFGYGVSYEQFEEMVYQSQPAGLQNLQDNPSYVTFELGKVASDRRLWEMAHALKEYYQSRKVELPPVHNTIPDIYDPAFDYHAFREELSAILFTKHPYTAEVFKGDEGIGRYRELAIQIGDLTPAVLNQV